MRKFLSALVILCGIAISSMAQTTPGGNKFNIGVDLGIPFGDASSLFDLGAGASLKYELPIANSLAVTGSVGYTAFIVKNEFTGFEGQQSVYSYIPIKAGLKYYIENGFFVEGQAGVTLFAGSGGGTSFAVAPNVGYSFDGGFEISGRYESWSKKDNGSINQAAVRVSYSFK
jgi:hypothetical protein